MADVEFDEGFFDAFARGWKVPVGVSESEQVCSVMQQMREIGLDPDQAWALEHVREVNRARKAGEL